MVPFYVHHVLLMLAIYCLFWLILSRLFLKTTPIRLWDGHEKAAVDLAACRSVILFLFRRWGRLEGDC